MLPIECHCHEPKLGKGKKRRSCDSSAAVQEKKEKKDKDKSHKKEKKEKKEKKDKDKKASEKPS